MSKSGPESENHVCERERFTFYSAYTPERICLVLTRILVLPPQMLLLILTPVIVLPHYVSIFFFFFGLLFCFFFPLLHYSGGFPLWLTCTQRSSVRAEPKVTSVFGRKYTHLAPAVTTHNNFWPLRAPKLVSSCLICRDAYTLRSNPSLSFASLFPSTRLCCFLAHISLSTFHFFIPAIFPLDR